MSPQMGVAVSIGVVLIEIVVAVGVVAAGVLLALLVARRFRLL